MNIHGKNLHKIESSIATNFLVLEFLKQGGSITIIPNRGRKQKMLTSNARTKGCTRPVQFKGV